MNDSVLTRVVKYLFKIPRITVEKGKVFISLRGQYPVNIKPIPGYSPIIVSQPLKGYITITFRAICPNEETAYKVVTYSRDRDTHIPLSICSQFIIRKNNV